MPYIRTKDGLKKFTEEELLERNYKKKSNKILTKKEKIAKEKGTPQDQLDYIVKNGLEAYITEMKRIEG